jgi:hypothetical protein
MSTQNTIPLLREVIHRGEVPSDEIEIIESADGAAGIVFEQSESEHGKNSANDHFDEDVIEQEYHAALQQIQVEQQEIEFDTPTSDEWLPAKGETTPSPGVKELLVEEEIRMILERHMDNAYQDILKLISHKPG